MMQRYNLVKCTYTDNRNGMEVPEAGSGLREVG